MRKVFLIAISITVLSSMIFLKEGYGYKKTLFERLEDRQDISIYVEKIDDRDRLTPEGFDEDLRELIRDELLARMTLDFVPVDTPAAAEMILKVEIEEFVWREKGNASIFNPFATGASGRVQAVFTLEERKKKEVLWSDLIKATFSGRNVTVEEGLYALRERLVKVFFRESMHPRDVSRWERPH